MRAGQQACLSDECPAVLEAAHATAAGVSRVLRFKPSNMSGWRKLYLNSKQACLNVRQQQQLIDQLCGYEVFMTVKLDHGMRAFRVLQMLICCHS